MASGCHGSANCGRDDRLATIVLVAVPQSPAVATPPPATYPAGLSAGQSIVGETSHNQLVSPSREFDLYVDSGSVQLSDSGLARFGAETYSSAIWNRSAVVPFPDHSILAMQKDGNLVLYRANGTPIWSSGTRGSGATRFVVQNDGNLVLYTAKNRAVWASSTERGMLVGGESLLPGQAIQSQFFPEKQVFVMQTDGNLVDYVAGVARWSSRTFVRGARAVMQTDGNLVIYSSRNQALWSSGTNGALTDIDVVTFGLCSLDLGANGRLLWTTSRTC
jgi:hypothetical protein